MHHIVIQYAVPKKTPGSVLLKRWANATLGKKNPAEVTIRIVNTDEMTDLNTTYRNKKGPTNVLAFPFDMPKELNDDITILGDVVICSDVVEREAKEQDKTSKAHWAHMIVHGILHLLGHDHVIEKDAIIMETKETRILKTLGFPNPYKLSKKVTHHGRETRRRRK
jgi:probable rRNA maturation factor